MIQVGFQQALVRDVARVFCVLAVEWCTKLMRTRALATGNAPSPSTRLTPEDIKGVCPLLFAESQQLGTASGDSSAIDKVLEPFSVARCTIRGCCASLSLSWKAQDLLLLHAHHLHSGSV